MQKALLIALSLATGSIAAPGFGADWPQWRGPDRNGHAPASGTTIKSLPENPKTVWNIKAGPGLASPVVAGYTVIHFDAVDGKETIHALDRSTGEKRWSTAIDETFHDSQGPDGPRNTPVIDGDRVYAVSCRGQLDCLSLKDGRKIWGVNYTDDFGATFIGEKGNTPGAARHGNNATPLVAGDRLYTLAGGTEGAGVVCLDKMTGRVLWKSQDDQAAYAPPVLATLAGKEQLVCFMAEALIGLDPDDGKLLWRVPIETAYARHVTAPVWHDDVVVVSSHQAGLIGTKISRKGDGFAASQAWISKDSTMNFASPVAKGNYMYGLGPRKNLVCVEISTGKEMWSQDGYFQTSADKAYGGFMLLGDNVLALTDQGLLAMFAATPNGFKEAGQVQVCGANWCNPAYADGLLYLRDGNRGAGNVMCVDLR